MVGFIEEHRAKFGVEPICDVLPIAPSGSYEQRVRRRCRERRPCRVRRDEMVTAEIHRVWHENQEVYGVRKVWKQLRREGHPVARCTVARLMHRTELPGAVRGRKFKKTTCPDTATPRPPDLETRRFAAVRPNELWVADLTYVSTWRGFAYVAFVIDVFARRIVGWRVSSSLRSDLALDALEQALYDRQLNEAERLIHHSDRGTQYLSIRRICTSRSAPAFGRITRTAEVTIRFRARTCRCRVSCHTSQTSRMAQRAHFSQLRRLYYRLQPTGSKPVAEPGALGAGWGRRARHSPLSLSVANKWTQPPG